MIKINIPGHHDLLLTHLVLYYNRTVAVNGMLFPSVDEALIVLSSDIQVHVIKADRLVTYNTLRLQYALGGLPPCIFIIQKQKKPNYEQST